MSELAHGRPGYAMGLDASKQMKWIELTPAHSHPRFRGYLERSERERLVARALTPAFEVRRVERSGTALAHQGGHPRLANTDRRFAHATRAGELGVQRVDASRHARRRI